MKKSKSNILYILLLLIATIALYLPIINKFYVGHDTTFHLTNMNMFIEKILKLNFFSYKIFGKDVAYGLGYGTFIFYPPLSYMSTASIANILCFYRLHKELSITLTLTIIAFLSSVSMFYFTNKLFNNKKISILAGVSYVSSIYFLCNNYVRCAIAESLTFIFIPIIFSALYELFNDNKKKFYILFILGYTGMLTSHLIISIYLTILILILFIINYKKAFKLKYIKPLLLASLIVLLITSSYTVPLLEHKILGKYAVFDNKTMYSLEELQYHMSHFIDYFRIGNKTENGIKVYFNYVTLITSIVVLLNVKRILNKKERIVYKNILILLLISIFITSALFPWEYMPKLLYNIQFPWRIFTFVSFAISVLSCQILRIFPSKYENIVLFILVILTISFSISSLDNTHAYGTYIYNYFKDDLGHQVEYLPVKTKENYEYFKNRSNTIEITSGEGKIKEISNNTPSLKAKIKLDSEKITLELPRLYYLGYRIELIDKDNNKTKLEYYENDNGFISVDLSKSGTLTVKYKGTLLANIANIISVITTFIFTIIMKKSIK